MEVSWMQHGGLRRKQCEQIEHQRRKISVGLDNGMRRLVDALLGPRKKDQGRRQGSMANARGGSLARVTLFRATVVQKPLAQERLFLVSGPGIEMDTELIVRLTCSFFAKTQWRETKG